MTDLVNDRRKKAEEKNARDRAAYARKNEERNKLRKKPLQIIARDQKLLRNEIRKWKDSKEQAENQIRFLEGILAKTAEAGKFLISLSREIYDSLTTPQEWQKYPELNYIFDMKGLF